MVLTAVVLCLTVAEVSRRAGRPARCLGVFALALPLRVFLEWTSVLAWAARHPLRGLSD